MTLTKKLYFSFILSTLLLTSCQQYSSSFEFLRNPNIRADVNGESWVANSYVVRNLGKVVYYSDPSDTEGEIFFRVSIIGFRDDSNIERMEITIDVKDINNMIGTYTTTYTENGGINNIEWIEPQTTAGFFPFYSLCSASDANTEFVIERQSLNETLITGSFRTTLCERTDASDQVEILDGSFRDLRYEEEE